MMDIALAMARRGLGRTAPNPSVGAVIADPENGVVISRATTADGGRPHAETQAIAKAGASARGATLYVTLEPCSHEGRTGPCADAVIAAGLRRVVVAIEDPDPRVAGRGLDKLRAAGLRVERGLGADEARQITRGHVVRVTERRPVVTIKMALAADGTVPRGDGHTPRFVTGPQARRAGHLLRARNDAILVGSGTVLADNPQLTCRLPGLLERSPQRIVIALDPSVLAGTRLATEDGLAPPLCLTPAGRPPYPRARLPGCEIVEVAAVGGRVWLPAAMEVLVARGMTRLLVEGGPGMWRAFADAALVDEVCLFVAGADHDEEFAARQIARWLGPVPLACRGSRRVGGDTMWGYHRAQLTKGLRTCSPA